MRSKTFAPKLVQFPLFFTAGVHDGYVDTVYWYGDLLLSKVRKYVSVLRTGPLSCFAHELSTEHRK